MNFVAGKKSMANMIKMIGFAIPQTRKISKEALRSVLLGTKQCRINTKETEFTGRCAVSRARLCSEIERLMANENAIPWFKNEKMLPPKKYLVEWLYSLSPLNSCLTLPKKIQTRKHRRNADGRFLELFDQFLANPNIEEEEDLGSLFTESNPVFFTKPIISRRTKTWYKLESLQVKRRIKRYLSNLESLISPG